MNSLEQILKDINKVFDKANINYKEVLLRKLEKISKQELIHQIVINNFSEYIKRADKTRPKPYIKGSCILPKKYQDNPLYEFREIKYWGKVIQALYNIETGEMVVKNSKSAGKPKYTKVNGQDIYNQRDNSFSRAFLKNTLSEYFNPFVKQLIPIQNIDSYPLTVEMIFYVIDENKSTIDNDNRWVWEKAFQDCLTNNGIIPDDNCRNISVNLKETVLLPKDTEQKLIINIYGGIN